MRKSTRKEIKALESMLLPELQARFAEVIGEETKAPNRKFLVRRITEALEARDAAAATPPENAAPAALAEETTEAAPAEEPAADAGDGQGEVKLSKLSVSELQAKLSRGGWTRHGQLGEELPHLGNPPGPEGSHPHRPAPHPPRRRRGPRLQGPAPAHGGGTRHAARRGPRAPRPQELPYKFRTEPARRGAPLPRRVVSACTC